MERQLVQDEGHQNEQLISLSEQILQLIRAIDELTVARAQPPRPAHDGDRDQRGEIDRRSEVRGF